MISLNKIAWIETYLTDIQQALDKKEETVDIVLSGIELET